MSDTHSDKGPHDMGGEQAGPVDTIDHGMRFWERQANGLRSTLSLKKIVRVDELRRAAEDLGDKYSQLEYFERRACRAASRRIRSQPAPMAGSRVGSLRHS